VKITAQEEYGLRCMVQLARHRDTEPLTIAEIARREALSLPYVGKLMALLRHAGLVESVRGRSGGYILPRRPSDIALHEIIEALGGELFERDHCDRYPAGQKACVHVDECSIRGIWGALGKIIQDVLSRTTLADLLGSEDKIVRITKALPTPDWPYSTNVAQAVSTEEKDAGGKNE
jgi:Rrf2 family protein